MKLIVKSLFPTLFANNWYMTCYLLFYPIHPYLNKIIKGMDQQTMLRATLALSFCYIIMDTLKSNLFFPSRIILWVAIYFVVAYTELYAKVFQDSVKANLLLFTAGLFCFIGLLAVTNLLGLHMALFSDQLMHWTGNCNVFTVMMSLALFNLFRQIHFHNRLVNYVSSLSLLIYIIHENIILRTYVRPQMWDWVYDNYGYVHVIGWVFIIAAVIFLLSALAATLYELLLQRGVNKLSDKLFDLIKRMCIPMENRLMRTLK